MNIREKLVELIANAKAMYAYDYTDHTEDEYIAETLFDNFITVWDGKPIEAFLHPIDAYKGLKAKYLVFKADTGEMVDNCFILRPDKDAAAVEALRAYAKVTDNETLAKDIYNWVGNGVTVQEWIPVTERLPETKGITSFYIDGSYQEWVRSDYVLGIDKDGYMHVVQYGEDEEYKWWEDEQGEYYDITHWMPLPEPPKEVE